MATDRVLLDGEKIRRLRKERSLVQKQLGDEVHCPRETINRIENRGIAAPDVANRIAAFLNLPLEAIMPATVLHEPNKHSQQFDSFWRTLIRKEMRSAFHSVPKLNVDCDRRIIRIRDDHRSLEQRATNLEMALRSSDYLSSHYAGIMPVGFRRLFTRPLSIAYPGPQIGVSALCLLLNELGIPLVSDFCHLHGGDLAIQIENGVISPPDILILGEAPYTLIKKNPELGKHYEILPYTFDTKMKAVRSRQMRVATIEEGLKQAPALFDERELTAQAWIVEDWEAAAGARIKKHHLPPHEALTFFEEGNPGLMPVWNTVAAVLVHIEKAVAIDCDSQCHFPVLLSRDVIGRSPSTKQVLLAALMHVTLKVLEDDEVFEGVVDKLVHNADLKTLVRRASGIFPLS
jgi:transcriptional regulator with XRE-family HTH domain